MKAQAKKVIFVCTANTCRSPMAEMILKNIFKKRGVTGIKVCSAGLNALGGGEMNAFAKAALKKNGVPRTVFKSKRIINASPRDLIICMTDGHKRAFLPRKNVFSFADIAGEEISDPYGEGFEAYEAVCARLVSKMERVGEFAINFLEGQ